MDSGVRCAHFIYRKHISDILDIVSSEDECNTGEALSIVDDDGEDSLVLVYKDSCGCTCILGVWAGACRSRMTRCII